MDVIVCNGFGAYLGMKTCEYLGNKVSSLLNTLNNCSQWILAKLHWGNDAEALFTLYWIAVAPPRKPYRLGLLFTHKNGCGGVTERICAAPISKGGRYILKRCSHVYGIAFRSFSWHHEKLSHIRVNIIWDEAYLWSLISIIWSVQLLKKKTNDLNCHIKTSLKVELKSILASFAAVIPIRSFKR